MTDNLPQKLTSFIGREHELEVVSRLLSTSRLLTLTGPGGCGKTRLALEVASRHADAYSDGISFVALAAISDPGLVLPTIAQSLGIMEAGSQPISETLENYLRDRHMLIVLDNFEQVWSGAPHVENLLKFCPRLALLVTSRAALRINGEHEFAVPPLALPEPALFSEMAHRVAKGKDTASSLSQYEAVRLFIQRARSVKPHFDITGENASSIAEICYRLDGLPLAIELAAARIRILSPQAMLSKLDEGDKLRLLTGGPRDLPSRQQALRNTIEWSYSLLDGDEKSLFRQLAVFVGGCELEAVEAVFSVGSRVREWSESELVETNTVPSHSQGSHTLLRSLIDKNLVKSDEVDSGEPRFVMLETIREYALERLEERGEAEVARQRHAGYYMSLAEQAEPALHGPNQVEWLDRLEREHGNLRAALSGRLAHRDVETASRLAAALCWFWFAHGHLSEGWQWVGKVLTHVDVIDAHIRARLMAGAGRIANHQADYAGARSLLDSALVLYRELGDRQGIADTLNLLGTVSIYSSSYERAREFYEESLQFSRELGDKEGIAKCLANLGTVAFYSGDYARARGLYEEGLSLHRELGDMWRIAALLVNLGEAASNQRDYAEAARRYKESLPLFYDLGDKASIAETLEGLAAAVGAWKGGQPERAAQLFGAADALRKAVGAPLSAAARPEYERNLGVVRSLINRAPFAEAWAQGEALTLEQALSLAAEETTLLAYPTIELTSREIDVLRLLSKGLSNDQISAKLSISSHTVHTHITSIYSKLGINSRVEATRYAVENGWA